ISTPGTGKPMFSASSVSHTRASTIGAVSVAPRPVRNATASPQLRQASSFISSNTGCETPAPRARCGRSQQLAEAALAVNLDVPGKRCVHRAPVGCVGGVDQAGRQQSEDLPQLAEVRRKQRI